MKTPTLLLAALLLTAACTADEPAASEPTADSQTPIAFAAYTTLTRSGLPVTSYASLQTEGFGVFAYYTRTDDYNSSTSPDFMYRQQVTWDGTAWAYSPVKYWPNDNTPADNSGAQGSLTASKVSFFAYAPYVGEGISGFTASSTTGDPKVSYATPAYPAWGADLVWGTDADGRPLKNKKRVDASGNIDDNSVKFYFHHALTRLGFEVQANYDTGSDDDHRKILIESVSVSSNALCTSGDLNLNSDDTPPLVPLPLWQNTGPVFSMAVGNDQLKSSYIYQALQPVGIPNSGEDDNGKAAAPRRRAATVEAQFEALPAGVTTTAQPLLAEVDEVMYYHSLVPQFSACDASGDATVSVTIKYHVITLDDDLPYGFSDQTTETTASAKLKALAAGRQYTVLLRLGLTSVKAEVTATSWDDSVTNTNVDIP